MSALDYRRRRGLDKKDEQMALLIQRVSGSYYGSYYMPCAAGVGYSYSPYQFMKNTDPKAGMLRLVMGLGTSAVDRTEGSYPRLVSLDRPEATTYTSTAEKHQYSQRRIEVVDTSSHDLKKLNLQDIGPKMPGYLLQVLTERDSEAEGRLRELGRSGEVRFISCQGLVKNRELMGRIATLMQCIQAEYGQPVDIEYTMNLSEEGEYTINLLQCRPLQVFEDTGKVMIPEDLPEEEIVLESKGASMGLSRSIDLDLILYVDPVAYYNLAYADKPSVARAIGSINWKYRNQGKHMMLMVPGRIGTSSPELGVPTAFSDISEFEVICEMEEKGAGYNPELSYGSHIFQDLVEAEILYTAVFANEKTLLFHPERLQAGEKLPVEDMENRDFSGVLSLYDVSGKGCRLYHDLESEQLILTAPLCTI